MNDDKNNNKPFVDDDAVSLDFIMRDVRSYNDAIFWKNRLYRLHDAKKMKEAELYLDDFIRNWHKTHKKAKDNRWVWPPKIIYTPMGGGRNRKGPHLSN